MRELLGACILMAVLLTGCGDAGGSSPGDQPSGTSTTQEDDGGRGY